LFISSYRTKHSPGGSRPGPDAVSQDRTALWLVGRFSGHSRRHAAWCARAMGQWPRHP